MSPIDLDADRSPDEILADAINRNTGTEIRRLKRTIFAVVATALAVVLVGGAVALNIIRTQNDLLSRRSVTVTYLGCVADYAFAIVKAEGAPTPEQRDAINVAEANLQRVRTADLAGAEIPKCDPAG